MSLKEAWVCLKEWSREMVTTALENGADALVIPAGWQERVKALGRITTVSVDGDLKPGQDVFFESLHSPEDEERIGRLLHRGPVALEDEIPGKDGDSGPGSRRRSWEVIPLENLLARNGRLFVPVHSTEEIDLALGILERGVAGVVIHTENPRELRALLKRVKGAAPAQALQIAVIESIRPAGLGDRVCVDTCTLMQEGEGLLVGSSSSFFFLVQAEAKTNPYVAPRPFRVNAGAVHAYVKVPEDRTRYLSELASGDPVLVVRADGATQVATVGRLKIERRPLLLLEAVCGEARGSILLQNAETIRLSNPEGKALSVVELKPGDAILAAVEKSGRHFGIQVEETIWEK
ncbi:3-dehydroquinate synthase II [Desulforhabdus sp. TSK]|uniref:3-dehydroquinate synthase II n=1 Tax=Desulforhabdus sp. TSK TaxID=2925014 RepID=UPI001FC8D9EB|nr:3-dehydroquinate synthase II [Desulforhabdus sp. TSK]GKT08784.1 3-dehydroquinate synthase [Desulforhabdus sp. TSK]